MFPPDDHAGAAIHRQVCPFVDEGDVIEWCFWEERGQRQHPYEDDAAGGKGVFSYKMHKNPHNLLLIGCKNKKIFILLQAIERIT